MTLKWTREAPKVAGWYWCREFRYRVSGDDGFCSQYWSGPMVVCVFAGQGGPQVHGPGNPTYIKTHDPCTTAEWSGPIPAPEEEGEG